MGICLLLSVYTILHHTALSANYVRRNIPVTNGGDNHIFIFNTLVHGIISPVFVQLFQISMTFYYILLCHKRQDAFNFSMSCWTILFNKISVNNFQRAGRWPLHAQCSCRSNLQLLVLSKIFSNIVAGRLRDRSTDIWLC